MDLKGSTFTITNVGSVGRRIFTPIINYPAAILGIGLIKDQSGTDGKVVIRKCSIFPLTFDHRIVDGRKPPDS